MQKGFWLDRERCVGCNACVVACKEANDLEPRVLGNTGPMWRRTMMLENGVFPSITVANLSLSCMHCGNAPCEAVCPTGAIQKRAEDGIVIVDRDKCIGCHYCFFACPFGVPQYGEDGTMQKCDFCLSAGIEPACVAACPSEALFAGTLEELFQMIQAKQARKLAGSTQPSILLTQ